MLVLRRKRHESVILGDEVTLTVEEICAGDGQRIFGATMRLGFQSPRYVSICRSELRADSSGAVRKGGRARPAQPRPGRLVEISDAQARLRVEVPPKVPVRCNGTPTVGVNSQETVGGATQSSTQVYHITCRKEDRITICHNIIIAALNFHRFVFAETR
jgi:sRNA-binding carbon storage regulator CsrA